MPRATPGARQGTLAQTRRCAAKAFVAGVFEIPYTLGGFDVAKSELKSALLKSGAPFAGACPVDAEEMAPIFFCASAPAKSGLKSSEKSGLAATGTAAGDAGVSDFTVEEGLSGFAFSGVGSEDIWWSTFQCSAKLVTHRSWTLSNSPLPLSRRHAGGDLP